MPANLGTDPSPSSTRSRATPPTASWDHCTKEEATTLRRGESGLFFYDLLKQKLQDLNPGGLFRPQAAVPSAVA